MRNKPSKIFTENPPGNREDESLYACHVNNDIFILDGNRGKYLDVSVRDYLFILAGNSKQIEKCFDSITLDVISGELAKVCRAIVDALQKYIESDFLSIFIFLI